MREDEPWMERMCARSKAGPEKRQTTPADIMEKLDLLERGFDDIEHRISNMDKEHTRYVRAVSYTHLDVYKRQMPVSMGSTFKAFKITRANSGRAARRMKDR